MAHLKKPVQTFVRRTCRNAPVNPFAVLDVHGAVIEHSVEQERRTQVRAVRAVVPIDKPNINFASNGIFMA